MELQSEQNIYGSQKATLGDLSVEYQYNHVVGKRPKMINIYVHNEATGFRVDGTYMLYEGHLRLHFQNLPDDLDMAFMQDLYDGVQQVLQSFADLEV